MMASSLDVDEKEALDDEDHGLSDRTRGMDVLDICKTLEGQFSGELDILKSTGPLSVKNLLPILTRGKSSLLRLHSRLHGIPHTLKNPLIRKLTDKSTPIEDAVVLIQILHYGIKHDPQLFTITEATSCLHTAAKNYEPPPTSKSNDPFSSLVSEFVHLLCEMASVSMETSLDITIPEALSSLKQYESFMDPSSQSKLASLLLTMTTNTTTKNETKMEPDSNTDLDLPPPPASHHLGGLGHKPPSKSPTKPHAVRVQQQTASTTQELGSEKTDLATLNLTNVLNAKARTLATSLEKEPLPSPTSKRGSDRGWFTSTYDDVEILLNLSKGKKPVSGGDQNYLFNKIEGFQASFSSRTTVNRMIAETFYHISGTQLISSAHTWKLLKQMQNSDDTTFCKWILQCVQRTFAREPSRYEKFEQDCLKDKLEALGDSKNDMELAALILEIIAQQSHTENDPALVSRMLSTAIVNVNRSDARDKNRDTATRLLNLHSMKPSSVKWFNTNCSPLVNIMVSPATSKVRKDVAEILENCLLLEGFCGFNGDFINKLSSILPQLSNREEDADVLEAVLRLVMKSSGSSLPPATLQSLVHCCVATSSPKVQSIILVAVRDLGKSGIVPENAEPLAVKLSDSSDLVDEITAAHEQQGEEDDVSCIPKMSTLAADILLDWAKAREGLNPSEETLLHVIQAMEASPDLQTRILSAEFLSLTMSSSTSCSSLLLGRLISLVDDAVPDIRANAVLALVSGGRYLSENSNSLLEPKLLDSITRLYSFSPLVFNGKELSQTINSGIVSIIENEVIKEGVSFGVTTISLLHHLLRSEDTQIDKIGVLKILQAYCEQGNNLPLELKQLLATFLDRMATKEEIIVDLTEDIFVCLISMGEPVESEVLGWFANSLFNPEASSSKYGTHLALLCHSCRNQDLPESVFRILHVELLCGQMLHQIHTKTGPILGWDVITKYLEKGGKASILLLDVVTSALITDPKPAIQILQLIAENGQNVPTRCLKVLGIVVIEGPDYLCLARLMLENGQVLPRSVMEAPFKMLEDRTKWEEMAPNVAPFLNELHQRNGHLLTCSEQMGIVCKLMDYGADTLYQHLLPIFIKSLKNLKLPSAEESQKMVSSLFKILQKEITTNTRTHFLLALEGLAFLVGNETDTKLGDNEVNTIVDMFKSKENLLQDAPSARKHFSTIFDSHSLSELQIQEVGIADILALQDDTRFLTELYAYGNGGVQIFNKWPHTFDRVLGILRNQKDPEVLHQMLDLLLKNITEANESFLVPMVETFVAIVTSEIGNSSLQQKSEKWLITLLQTRGKSILKSTNFSWISALEQNYEKSQNVLVTISSIPHLSLHLGSQTNFTLHLKLGLEGSNKAPLKQGDFDNFLKQMTKGDHHSEEDGHLLPLILEAAFKDPKLVKGDKYGTLAQTVAYLVLHDPELLDRASPSVKVNATKMILETLASLKPKRINVSLPHAARLCLSHFPETERKNIVQLLDKVMDHLVTNVAFWPSDGELFGAVLSCLVALLKSREDMVTEPQLRSKLEATFYKEITNKLGNIRHLCFSGLSVLNNSAQKSAKFVDYVDILVEHLEKSSSKLPKVSTFLAQIGTTPSQTESLILSSFIMVDTWDLNRLEDILKEKWRESILVSDILSHSGQLSISDQLKILENLRKLRHGDATLLLRGILALLQRKIIRARDLLEFLGLLTLLPSPLANDVVCFSPFPCQEWFPKFQERVLHHVTRTVVDKDVATSKERVKHFTTTLQTLLGPSPSITLLSTLEKVQDMDEVLKIVTLLGPRVPDSHLKGPSLKRFLELEALKKLCVTPERSLVKKFLHSQLESLLEGDGINFSIVADLLTLLKTCKRPFILPTIIRILHDNQVPGRVFQDLTLLLKSSPEEDSWIHKTNEICNRFTYTQGTTTLKSPSEIVDDFISSLAQGSGDAEYKFKLNKSPLSPDIKTQLKQVLEKVSKGTFGSQILKSCSKDIRTWKSSDILEWAKHLKSLRGRYEVTHEFCMEAVAVGNRAFYLTKNFQLTSVQILSIYSGMYKGLKGQLLQVHTGSGKSAIIAILSALTALRGGFKVDVITSSPVLAKRDAESWSKFYALFGLSCSFNGDPAGGVPYTKGPKPCYSSDIVYGEISDFQFDILRDEYSDLGTLGGRRSQFAVVDEVDSMLLDDISKLARLSSPLPGMDVLQIIYHIVWHRLLSVEKKLFTLDSKTYFIEGKVIFGNEEDQENVDTGTNPSYKFADPSDGTIYETKDLLSFLRLGQGLGAAGIICIQDADTFIRTHLTDFLNLLVVGTDKTEPKIKVPTYFYQMVKAQIPKWVDSCITAYTYQENVHYLVDQGKIKPIDYATTGIVQSGTAWSEGLHQFLQLKHSLKLTSESITTNFLSNMSFFQRYTHPVSIGSLVLSSECSVIGLTGTLGSNQTRQGLWDLYRTASTELPSSHTKQYVQYPDTTCGNEAQWLGQICASAQTEILRGRGVLIICETIKDVITVQKAINATRLERFQEFGGVRVYTKNDSNQEQHFERIKPGEVFIATNLAGRGTDVNTKEIEASGGLHVCLTFLPTNTRVEAQAFGRTSRQGNRGSGQLICLSRTQSPNQNLRQLRDLQEEAGLSTFMTEDLPLVKVKDECFSKFCKFLGKCRRKIKEEKGMVSNITGWGMGLTLMEICVIQAMEERWSLFLRQVDLGIIPPEEAIAKYTSLQMLLSLGFFDSKKSPGTNPNHLNVIKSPFHHIIMANDLFNRGSQAKLVQAESHFRSAIALDPSFATGAYIGLGFLLLRSAQGDQYRTQALTNLEKAAALLQEEMGQLQSAQSLMKQRNWDLTDSDLFVQLETKIGMLGSMSNCVLGAITTTTESLRAVDFAISDKSSRQDQGFSYFTLENRTDDTKSCVLNKFRSLDESSVSSISLKFHNLTSHDDGGSVDQAVNTIQTANLQKGEEFKVHCLTNYATLLSLLCPDIAMVKISKSEALSTIQMWNNSYASIMSKLGPQMLHKSGNFRVSWYSGEDEDQVHCLGTELPYHKAQKLIEDRNATDLLNVMFTSCNSKVFDLFKQDVIALSVPDLRKDKATTLLQALSGKYSTLGVTLVLSKASDFETLKTLPISAKVIKTWDNGSKWATISVSEGPTEFSSSASYEASISDLPPDSKLITTIFQNFGENTIFSLTFGNLDPSFLHPEVDKGSTQGRNRLRDLLPPTMSLILSPDMKRVKEAITFLREKRVSFTLNFSNLPLSRAIKIVASSSLDREDIVLSKKTKNIYDLYTLEGMPLAELAELSARGILILCEFNEQRPIPWWSICSVIALGTLQAGLGVVLICTGFGASVGLSLIAEGINDFMSAYSAYSTRQFSWTNYRTRKAISYTIMVCTVGMSGLKDAAKGASVAWNGVASKFTSAATTQVLVKEVGVKATTKQLGKLAAKQVAVSLSQAVGRKAINAAVDVGLQYAMSSLRPQLIKILTQEVRNCFLSPKLNEVLALLWALDQVRGSATLRGKVDRVLRSVVNPQSSFFTQQWNSIGLPLCQGILSDPNYLGSPFAATIRVVGILNGIKEIATVMRNVSHELFLQLSKEDLTVVALLNQHCKISLKEAKLLGESVVPLPPQDGRTCASYQLNLSSSPSSPHAKGVKDFFEKLNKSLSSFNLERIDPILKSVVDSITDHIIKIADTQLIKPMTTFAVGKAVNAISSAVESRYLVTDGKSGSVAAEIKAKQKEYQKEYEIEQKRLENAAIISSVSDSPPGPGEKEASPGVKAMAAGVATDAPAGLTEMTIMASKHGILLDIVGPNYKPTPEDAASGRSIVRFTPGEINPETGLRGDGHYDYFDPEKQEFVNLSDPSDKDCGYDVMSHITKVPVDQLRLETAKTILAHPSEFEKVLENEISIIQSNPIDATTALLIGAGTGRRKRVKVSDPSADGDGNGDDDKKPPQQGEEQQDTKQRRRKRHRSKDEKSRGNVTTLERNEDGTKIRLSVPVGTTKGTPVSREARSKHVSPHRNVVPPTTEQVNDGKYPEKGPITKRPYVSAHVLHRGSGGTGRSDATVPLTYSANAKMYHAIEKAVMAFQNEVSIEGLEGQGCLIVTSKGEGYNPNLQDDPNLRDLPTIVKLTYEVDTENKQVQDIFRKYFNNPDTFAIKDDDGRIRASTGIYNTQDSVVFPVNDPISSDELEDVISEETASDSRETREE